MAKQSKNNGWTVVVKPVGTPEQGQEAQQRAMKIIAEWARQNHINGRNGRSGKGEGRATLESRDIS